MSIGNAKYLTHQYVMYKLALFMQDFKNTEIKIDYEEHSGKYFIQIETLVSLVDENLLEANNNHQVEDYIA